MIAILPQKPLRFYDVDYSTPCNIEAEEAVIGGILIDPGAMARVMETKLESDHFIIISHQIIYRAFRQLHGQDKEIDLMTVTIWLADNKLLEEVGGSHKLAQLVERTVSAVNIDAYALLIREKFVQRSVIEFANNALVLGQQNIPINDLLDRLKAEAEALEGFRVKEDGAIASESEIRFNAICKDLDKIEANENLAFQDWEMKRLAKEWNFRSTKELLDFHAKFLDSRHRKGEKLTYGLSEYFEKFADSSTDWLIRGWIPNKVVTVLHAAGGVGKTRLVSSICRALIAGKSWSGYDVESPTCVLFIETDQGSVVNIKMFDEQGYLDESEEVRSRLRINDDWNINQYGRLKAMLNAFRESHPDSKILVVVDSLTTVSSKATFSENDQEFARPLVRFRAIAEEFNCSFLVLHHSNRSGECRGSTAIFNAADQVFKLERLDPKNAAGALTLDIQKTRNRAPGKYCLQYDESTWTWKIAGRIEADGSIEDNYGAIQKLILDHVKLRPGIGYEAEEFGNILNCSTNTCRKELAALEREGLINSIRRGRAKKVYFVGQLTEVRPTTAAPTNSDSSGGLTFLGSFTIPKTVETAEVIQTHPQNGSLQPVESAEVIQTQQVGKFSETHIFTGGNKAESAEVIQVIREKKLDRDLEKTQKNADHLDQLTEPLPAESPEVIRTPDHFGSLGSLQQSQQPESSLPRENLLEEAVTVDMPVAIADIASLKVGDKIITASGTELVEIDHIKKPRIYIKMAEADKFMIQKAFPKASWVTSDDKVACVYFKEFKMWADLMCLRVVKQAIPETNKSPEVADEPDWQPGDKLLMSVTGSLKKYEVEFVGFKVETDGSYKAIVLDEGKQVEWAVDRLSPEGGR